MNISTAVSLLESRKVEKLRTDEKIAVVGLGYVGLPVAVGLAKHFQDVVGFDICGLRVSNLEKGIDQTNEFHADELNRSRLKVSCSVSDMERSNFYIVTVPTPIDKGNRPYLFPIKSACQTIGQNLNAGDVVVFESTVYPGVTEEICGPILEEVSGLTCGVDFTLGYSPERINPGDTEHRIENIIKVVSAQDETTLKRISSVYGSMVKAGIHEAPSIRVAETAKVIENTQRDVNIALMNEIAMICDKLDINSHEVIEAASTKWNFLPFSPGLVGGHCIGVDPYYLTAKAEEVGYNSEVILSGRRVNDGMGEFIAAKAIKMLATNDTPLSCVKVGVLGLTFKENVPDLRNSKTFDLLNSLAEFGVKPLIHDPMVEKSDIPPGNYTWTELKDMVDLDMLILAVPHHNYVSSDRAVLGELVKTEGAIIDVRSALDKSVISSKFSYWNL